MNIETASYNFCGVGDICLSDHPLRQGYGIGTRSSEIGVSGLLGEIADLFREVDDTFANLETAVREGSASEVYSEKPFSCSEDYLAQLSASNISLLSTANNHSLDHGPTGFEETVRLLQKHKLPTLGLVDSEGNAIPVVRQQGDIRVCWLGYNAILKAADHYPYATLQDMPKVLAHIACCRQSFDHVVISCHWGLELIDDAPLEIKVAAHRMIDAGASVILGHHPHVVQEFERYGNGVIAYSLGDFLFDLTWCKQSNSSAILKVEMLKNTLGRCEVVRIRRKQDLRLEIVSVEQIRGLKEKFDHLEDQWQLVQPSDLTDPQIFGGTYLRRYRQALAKNQISKVIFLLSNARKFGGKFFWHLIRRKLFPH